MPHVNANEITVSFGGVDVLRRVSIELRPGEVHAITGENGAGKSSLGKVIAGVYHPRSGSVLIDQEQVRFRNPREAQKRGIALIHQEPLSFLELNVMENVFAGNYPRMPSLLSPLVDRRGMRSRAQALLSELDSDLDPSDRVAGLSVAQQQMVELASAMAHDASVWIFDETTAPLTPKEVGELFVIVRKLRDRGCAIAFISHHLDEVFEISNRITVLRDGAKVAEKQTSETTVKEIVGLMVGRELSSENLRSGKPIRTDPVLELNSLSGPGFKDVSLRVHPGEVVCLAGLIGAGRTELARAIFGIAKATSGSITFEGSEISVRSPKKARALGIALVPEDRQHDGLLTAQSVAFNSTLCDLSHLSSAGWLNFGRLRRASADASRRLQLVYRDEDQPVLELSGGNQQKVVLGKWLMTAPKLLILDEPTRGVDVGAKHEVHKLIRAQADQGLAVLMISSDLPEVLAVSDRILVMREGHIVSELQGDEANEEKVMFAATGQEAR